MNRGAIVEEGFVYKEETNLTVLKTSLFFAGDGFTAYDSKGKLVFRVDSYGPVAGDAVLMDAAGRCILTVRRKVTTLMTLEPSKNLRSNSHKTGSLIQDPFGIFRVYTF